MNLGNFLKPKSTVIMSLCSKLRGAVFRESGA